MVTPSARALNTTPSRLLLTLKYSFVNLERFGFSIVSGLPSAPVGRVRYQYARSMTSAGRFALPAATLPAPVVPATAAAPAVVTVPATGESAEPVEDVAVLVTVPTRLPKTLSRPPVTSVTLAAPETSLSGATVFT